ncbi:fibronectin type III domain-containing protein [Oscillatoria sp. FACHB-1407]|uniref:fibronectin type III domain-containing protein n=1 Tax=Oscillatoria sp. FACHB-1407 TaxID=2692847 RepID=UPI0016835861|nr:fibronectin type III domain-containing protein [Oscillatoria sp. FACHB-1407]MBD2460853.1 fibronectin type III domain-containing protein [Oscillatoria sp. FACHB-1407]
MPTSVDLKGVRISGLEVTSAFVNGQIYQFSNISIGVLPPLTGSNPSNTDLVQVSNGSLSYDGNTLTITGAFSAIKPNAGSQEDRFLYQGTLTFDSLDIANGSGSPDDAYAITATASVSGALLPYTFMPQSLTFQSGGKDNPHTLVASGQVTPGDSYTDVFNAFNLDAVTLTYGDDQITNNLNLSLQGGNFDVELPFLEHYSLEAEGANLELSINPFSLILTGSYNLKEKDEEAQDKTVGSLLLSGATNSIANAIVFQPSATDAFSFNGSIALSNIKLFDEDAMNQWIGFNSLTYTRSGANWTGSVFVTITPNKGWDNGSPIFDSENAEQFGGTIGFVNGRLNTLGFDINLPNSPGIPFGPMAIKGGGFFVTGLAPGQLRALAGNVVMASELTLEDTPVVSLTAGVAINEESIALLVASQQDMSNFLNEIQDAESGTNASESVSSYAENLPKAWDDETPGLSILDGRTKANGSAILDWESGIYELDVSVSLSIPDVAEDFIQGQATFSIDSNLDFKLFANVDVVIPDSIPLIGGKQLADVGGIINYTNNNNRSDDFAAGWFEIDLGFWSKEVGGQVNFDGTTRLLGADQIAQLEAAGAESVTPAQSQGLTFNRSGETYMAIEVNYGSPNNRPSNGFFSHVTATFEEINPSFLDEFVLQDTLKAVNLQREAQLVYSTPTSDLFVLGEPNSPIDLTRYRLTGINNGLFTNFDYSFYDFSNAAPQITIQQLELQQGASRLQTTSQARSQASRGTDSVTIHYGAFDADSRAKVSLYYDTDGEGYDGVLIAKNLRERDRRSRYIWDTRNLDAGKYYVYAVVEDGGNVPQMHYFHRPIVISEAGASARVTGVEAAWTGNDSVTLSWSPARARDIAYYAIDYTDQASGISENRTVTVGGNQTSLTIPDLQIGDIYRFTVRAIDQDGNDSLESESVAVLVGNRATAKLEAGEWHSMARPGRRYTATLDLEDNEAATLLKAPKGAKLNQDGRFSWRVAPTASGWQEVRIQVTDPYGRREVIERQIFVQPRPGQRSIRGQSFSPADHLVGEVRVGSPDRLTDNSQALVGTLRDDRFMLQPNRFIQIKHFDDGEDYLQVKNTTFDEFDIVQQGKNTLIQLDGKTIAELYGLRSSLITAADFVLS